MSAAIALSTREVPGELLRRPDIARRVYGRGGDEEVRFAFIDPTPSLPIIHERQFLIAAWGSRQRRTELPSSGWVWKEDLQRELWSNVETHRVTILANAGCENQIWYRIRHGIQGLLVYRPDGEPVVYMLVEPASHYFRIMTRSTRMPILIGEVI